MVAAGLSTAAIKRIYPCKEPARGETVPRRCKANQGIPYTINFVFELSYTGDIEQTLELGAHGTKALAVLIVRE
jgi:hypothetical protein